MWSKQGAGRAFETSNLGKKASTHGNMRGRSDKIEILEVNKEICHVRNYSILQVKGSLDSGVGLEELPKRGRSLAR